MTRFRFFATFLGALGLAKAQTVVHSSLGGCYSVTGDTAAIVPCPDELAWKTGKARNGQCPVCGLMVPPFKPTVETWFSDITCMAPTGAGAVTAICRHPTEADLPKSEDVRCARCNAKFVQDAV